MAEYIEREALIAKLKQMELGEHGLVERLFADGVYAVIETFPAADVAPVVHGRWEIDDGKNHCHCTACFFGRNVKTQIGWNYCPNCGAWMDGGADCADV